MSRSTADPVPRGLVRSLSSQWETTVQRQDGMPLKNGAPRLHNKILQEIISKMYGELEVVTFTVEQLREQGENTTSNISSVQVLLSDKSHVNLVYKSLYASSPNAKILNLKELYKKEEMMYSKVIPMLIATREDDPLTTFPLCYHTASDFIVLDDLQVHGYKKVDNEAGLDADHCKLVFTELGRFHAAAHLLTTAASEDITSVLNEVGKEVLYTEERRPIYEEHFAELARRTVDIIKKTSETTKYAKQVEGILSNTHKNLMKFLNFKGKFQTLTHGDLCNNNLMFAYTESEPIRVKFLDFQTCRFGSPALDIVYFLYTSITDEVRDKNMDDFIRTYHWSLSRSLHQLGINSGMSLVELRREVESLSIYGLLAAHLLLGETFADRDLYSKRIAEIVLDLGERKLL